MNPQQLEYVRYRLERARQSLDSARINIERRLLNDAVNRIYYACFYAVSAPLLIDDLGSTKHSGVRSLFEQHFVKTEQFPREMGRFYHRIFDSRIDGDYADLVTFALQDVETWFTEANDFVAKIANRIDEHLSGSGAC